MTDTPTDAESRSVSRGRDAFQSSGRGGAGNIRHASLSRDARPSDGPDDFSPTRGREPAIHPDRVYSVGRGGAGNITIRSPSRDALKGTQPEPINEDVAEAEYQAKLVREHAEATTIHSSGRGGAGNISASRSRSRGPGNVNLLHSSGRGGVGNIHTGSSLNPEALDEDERKQHAHHDAIHSTGRGGAANITAAHGPDIERVTHHLGEFESSGRGGVGNIRSRSESRDPAVRSGSKEKHGIAAIFDKISHPHAHAQPVASSNEGRISDVAH
ncbi:hypothetical protein OG21DRAFT_1417982 [Imleria badia]|nr:hypothetical protein OG21DRAFT_1417982 [Imleria badia]